MSLFSWYVQGAFLSSVPGLTKEITIITNKDEPETTAKFFFLTQNSAYFKKACGQEWKEGQTRTIELAEVEPDTFTAYLFWVYKEQVAIETDMDIDDIYIYHVSQAFDALVKLWLLGDRFA